MSNIAPTHTHQWFQAKEDASFRCGVWKCGARLPLNFLSDKDPAKIGGLSGAYDLYVKLSQPRAEHAEADAPDVSDSVPPRSKSQTKRLAIQAGTKTCSVCGEEKPRVDFHKRARSSDGLQSRCKECNVEAVKRSRTKKREERDAETSGGISGTGGDGLSDGEELRDAVEDDATGLSTPDYD